ncbi:RHOMBOID-like protein 1 [Linum grandiflorum]
MGRRRDSNAYEIDVSDEDDRRSKRGDDFKPFKQWFPWLIPSFVAANCVMFVVSMFVNDCPAKSRNCIGAEFLGRFAFQPLKENPLLGPSSDALMKLGAMEVEKVVEGHQPWRLISCIWLHAGVFHLLANMLSLLFIGIRLEQEFGFSMSYKLFLHFIPNV